MNNLVKTEIKKLYIVYKKQLIIPTILTYNAKRECINKSMYYCCKYFNFLERMQSVYTVNKRTSVQLTPIRISQNIRFISEAAIFGFFFSDAVFMFDDDQ